LTYTYDELGRRISASGNPAPEPRDTATNTATVNALNQYTTLNGKTLAYDANGNQSFKNAVWDARDRLVSLSGPSLTASFTYDAFDRRTSKTVNGQTKTYHYDGADLISETGAEYTFGPGIDEPLKRKSGQNEYYLSDALGSVIGLADGNGVIKTSYNYSPFGKKQTTGASSDNPFTFTGREDDGTGLYYYRARYYSHDQKRFISADPLGFGGGDSNFYAYVGNNPINFTDPSGESFESFAQGLAVGGASGLVASIVITAALTASGVTIGPLVAAVLYLGGGAALIASINEIAHEPCPDKRDYLLGALIGGAVGGGLGAKLGGGLGAGLRAKGGGSGSPCSFVEGTPVQTQEGTKPIEKVKLEDSVLARNEKTGEQSYHKVSQTFATPNDEIYDLELTGQDGKSDVLGVTGNHPFWLKGKGWTESDLLRAGDLVAGKDGTWLKVSKLALRADRQTAYNLEVDKDHTYFVGLAGAWVHNACKILKANSEASGPHSVFKVNPQTGKVSSYETFKPQTNPQNSNPWESVKRVDVEGRPHFNKVTQEYVPTPHVQSRKIPGGVRPATPRQIPR
jgi:RHS repeat-associated protein